MSEVADQLAKINATISDLQDAYRESYVRERVAVARLEDELAALRGYVEETAMSLAEYALKAHDIVALRDRVALSTGLLAGRVIRSTNESKKAVR